ncbi:hypothetical protein CEXT_553891 [Caerostris extrusa]|uniref:Uncharacterized protein n=1 Tax=Caerostris extrusa TaxID=172846 RepID=A0AAV4NME5_CAEEX|nr:hypothetical protein CEXT_553891 [Caerostris extrusa]
MNLNSRKPDADTLRSVPQTYYDCRPDYDYIISIWLWADMAIGYDRKPYPLKRHIYFVICPVHETSHMANPRALFPDDRTITATDHD